jgi:hypothetical protein
MAKKSVLVLSVLGALVNVAQAGPQHSVWGLKVGDAKKVVADDPAFKCAPSLKEARPFEHGGDVEAVVCEWHKDSPQKPAQYGGLPAPERLTVKFYKPFKTIGLVDASSRGVPFEDMVSRLGGSPDVKWSGHKRSLEAHWVSGDLVTTLYCGALNGCNVRTGKNAKHAKELAARIKASKSAASDVDGKAKGMMDAFNSK